MMLDERPAGEDAPAAETNDRRDAEPAAPDSGQAPSGGDAPEELEDVEHEGKTYKIPKPLKGALLMQADYARKTQDLAQAREAIEKQQREFGEQQKLHLEMLGDFGRLKTLDDAIAEFENADWAQLRASNPQKCDQLWFQYQQTKLAKERALTAFQQKVQQRDARQQEESARLAREFRAALQRELPEWNDDLSLRLNAYGASLGFTPEELAQVRDPRVVKALHAAWAGAELQKKQAAAERAKPAQAAKPLPTVSGNGAQTVRPTDPASDRLSTEEWAKRRNDQIRRKRV